MKLSVLVVGGAGYIGSHMCRMLLEAGHCVTVFDNLSRGHEDAVGNAELIVGDLRSEVDLAKCFADRQFDLVMQFAALTYVGESVEQPATYYDNNAVGSLRLLVAMQKAGVHRIVFSSTCAIYGEPTQRLLTESHQQAPVNPYGRSKLIVEQMLRDLAVSSPLRSVSLRYFNAAGCDPSGELGERHDPETHLIPLILTEAQRVSNGGNPATTNLRVFGLNFATADGSCVRDYVHVNDLCSAHLKAAERLMGGFTAGAEAFNLGTGCGQSVLEVIESCRRVTGIPIQYQIAARRAGDAESLVGNADLAKEVLAWSPQYASIDAIVATAWNWMVRANDLRVA